MIQAKIRSCPYCDSRNLIKKGVRKNHTRALQVYRCLNCRKYFTPLSAIRTKYSPELISRSLLLYYQGLTQENVSLLMKRKHKATIPRRTIGKWITGYKTICTFSTLRSKAISRNHSSSLTTSYALNHRQVYIYKKHDAKLNLLLQTLDSISAKRLSSYLEDIMKPTFPHNLFQEQSPQVQTKRSSQLSFQTLPFITRTNQNNANDLATLGLFLAHRAIERHPMIEEFMLTCDAKTIAIEVPVYLQRQELEYFQEKGFFLPIDAMHTPITGHIDVVQIRNGKIYILDYKPEAKKVNPVNQLILYALALASRTRLPLKTFVCAWFDEKDYFSFYPLHAVYQKNVKEI